MLDLTQQLNALPIQQLAVLFIAILWDTIWKGIGMWNAAENKHKGWFIAILLINSVGIVPIIYITWFKNKK